MYLYVSSIYVVAGEGTINRFNKYSKMEILKYSYLKLTTRTDYVLVPSGFSESKNVLINHY